MAPARSIQCMRRPPSKEPRGLVSLGRTISAMSDCESRTGRGISSSSFSFMNLFSKGKFGHGVANKIADSTPPSSECEDRRGKKSRRQAKHRIPACHGLLDDGHVHARTIGKVA